MNMSRAIFSWKSLSFSKLGSTIMGFVALFSTQAQSSTSDTSLGNLTAAHGATSTMLGHVEIRTDEHHIYFSEDGRASDVILIDSSPEGSRIKGLLDEFSNGTEPVRVPVNRTIVADGGAGKHFPSRADRPKGTVDRTEKGK
jgi:hypothetical protein